MKVVFLPAAEVDLSSLFLHIRDELHNEIAARNIATKILQRAQDLASFPEMGANLGNIDRKLDSYRYLSVDNYIIIYRLNYTELCVVRILYARSDYAQLLKG